MSQEGWGRQYFQQMQPTFSIELPRTTATSLEFLDHSDPSKDAIVRKKAREWVNKNKANSKQSRDVQVFPRAKRITGVSKEAEERQEQQVISKSKKTRIPRSPLHEVGTSNLDPFNLLPEVGRNYDHVLQFFLTSCPEEIPCSDDKYSNKSKHSLIPFSTDNTVLGNMAKSKASFILWLYATVSIRDGMFGCINSEEVQWFYNKALRVLQETLKNDVESGEYSDHLLNCLACIAATSSFSGMFKTAEVHRDALIRVLTLRGGGDIVKGISSAPQWSIKAMQWCEIMVATQLVELPKIPYLPFAPSKPAPKHVTLEAARRTSVTLACLPRLSEPVHKIIHLLHHLGIAYTQPAGTKIDSYVIQPLYDAEYALLQVLSQQKAPGHGYSETEILLAEGFQLYFWTGPRVLPPQTRTCDLLISRIMRALLPLLVETVPDISLDDMPATSLSLQQGTESILASITDLAPRPCHPSQDTKHAIIWSLALGTIVSSTLCRPEHSWFKEHLRLQIQAAGLNRSEQEYREFLKIFPTTDGFDWIDLRTLYAHFRPTNI